MVRALNLYPICFFNYPFNNVRHCASRKQDKRNFYIHGVYNFSREVRE